MYGKRTLEVLSNRMTFLSSLRRTGVVTLWLSATLTVPACAVDTQMPQAESCQTTSVTFVGFSEGPGDIQQGDKVLWEGRLAAYDPSTDISAYTQVCAVTDQEILVHAGGKTYRASLPADRAPYYVLIDSRSTESAVQDFPFLLD